MSENNQKAEIRRMRTLLQKIGEMAEHAEQTGSFEGGVRNSVTRYNAIVEHLEDINALPEELFPQLDERADWGQLGPEATLLADYLGDILEGEPKETGPRRNLGELIGLAPFLEGKELSQLIHTHFLGSPPPPPGAPVPPDVPPPPGSPAAAAQGPDLKTIVSLAPHLDKATLQEMVQACLSHQRVSDPNLLVALAPHMDSATFGQLLREHLPGWFQRQPAPPPAAEKPAPPEEGKAEELR
jgi:hypothetical protein